MSRKKTKLELTWIGKDKRPRLEPRILVEDPDLSHAADHRVSENDIFDNMLIQGDNLLALKALEHDFTGKIKCVLIDPPYNTGSAFEHYDDGVEHSLWLSLMAERLRLLRRLLREDGSIWIVIDDNEAHYLKVLCDELFGRQNFIGSITWQHSVQGKNDAKGLSLHHPDRYIMNILNIILGEGMSCRLFREIRERLGLAYDIHSYVSHFMDSGSLVVYGGVSPNNVESLIQAVLAELAKLKNEVVPAAELAKAKEMAKGRLLLRMEDSRSVSSWNGGQEILLGRIKSVEEMVSIIESVSTADIKRVAGDLFCSRGLNLATVGPDFNENRIKDLLVL